MKKLCAFSIIIAFSLAINAQLIINEIMSSNTSTLVDEYNEYDDWIEIYNTGTDVANLTGYYITDNPGNLLKFALPESRSVSGHGFLVLFADEDTEQGNLHLNFKLSQEGEIIILVKVSPTDTVIIDSVSFGSQLTDISYGCYPDGNNYYEFFEDPTPVAANVSGSLLGVAPVPDFSIPGGFYSGSQSIELSSEITGAEIRFTRDGSEPTESSTLYTSAIQSDTTFIIRAKVFADDYLPGKCAGYTYFINEHFQSYTTDQRLPVVSISSDNRYLWSAEEGLLHENNMGQEWERPAHIELYEPSGANVINQPAGITLFGHSTRRMEQKSLAIIARNSYGSNSFNYKIFNDLPFEEYKSFVMRNGGNDWSLTYFRDDLCQQLVRNDMDLDVQSHRQAILYVNGKFYGISSIKEKINEHYLADHHNANPDNIDMLQDNQTQVLGDNEEYTEFSGFILSNNLSNDLMYRELERKMDIKEYMNCQIMNIYIANIDMFLNSKYWRERENFGKWRWIVYDTEISYAQGDYSYTNEYGTLAPVNTMAFASTNENNSGWPFLQPWSTNKFIAMLNNEDFTNEFIQTFAVHINTTFKPQRVLNIIDTMQENIRREIPYQIVRYGGHTVGFNPYGTHFTSIGEWEYYVDLMRTFTIERPSYMRSFIQDKFALNGTYNLILTTDDPDRGKVFVQDIEVPFDSIGLYYQGIPIRISATPVPGYKFVKWTGLPGSDLLSHQITLTLSDNTTLEAVFEEEADVMISEIYYNSTDDDAYEFIELYNPKHATSVDLSGYALSESIDFIFPDGTIIEPNEYIIVAKHDSLYIWSKSQTFKWTTGSLDNTGDTLVLQNSTGITIDSVCYSNSAPWPVPINDHSIELISSDLDNNTGENWQNNIVAGGSAGIPAFTDAILDVKINEFLADNNNYNADENNEYNDWIEILNTGTDTVNIGGLYITNNMNNPSMYQILTNSPDATTMLPGEFLLLWADNDTAQGPLHLGFKLNAAGGSVGLSTDGQTNMDVIQYTAQQQDDSYGRYTDGTANWVTFNKPTPGMNNSYPPEFTSVPITMIAKRESYSCQIQTIDVENDYRIIGVYLKPNWLSFSDQGDGTAMLTGTAPAGNFSPCTVKLFVTDGYTKPVVQEFVITREPDTGLQNENFAFEQITVYPNPSQGLFDIEIYSKSNLIEIEITTITGQTVYSELINNDTGHTIVPVDLSNAGKGLYLLSCTTKERITTQKIVIR